MDGQRGISSDALRRHAPTFEGHHAVSFFVARTATPTKIVARSGQAAPRRDYCRSLATVDSLRYNLRASLSSPPYARELFMLDPSCKEFMRFIAPIQLRLGLDLWAVGSPYATRVMMSSAAVSLGSSSFRSFSTKLDVIRNAKTDGFRPRRPLCRALQKNSSGYVSWIFCRRMGMLDD